MRDTFNHFTLNDIDYCNVWLMWRIDEKVSDDEDLT